MVILPFIVFIAFLFSFVILWKYPSIGIYGSILLLILGELGRIPFPFFNNGILILDLFVLLFPVLWLIKKWWERQSINLGKLFVPFGIFFLIALLSLLFQTQHMLWQEIIPSAFYLIRFMGYFMLYIITLNEKIKIKPFLYILFITAFILGFLGILQLIFIPDFTFMYPAGWDPHIGRLLSTWFDPNFLGGFFAFVIIIAINLLFHKTISKRQTILCSAFILFLIITLFLTFSRSAYLMFFVGIFFTGIFRSPKILFGIFMISLLFMLFIPRVKERIENFYGSSVAFMTNSYDYSLDETAKLRVQSWQDAINIFQKNPLLGVGYNTLRFVKYNEGMAADTDIHSASGIDSSVLTILVTTGILGCIAYLWSIILMMKNALQRFKKETKNLLLQDFSIGFLFAFCGLLAHSLFVNSLLLPFFLVLQFVSSGIIEEREQRVRNV